MSVSQHDWSLHRKGQVDQERHKEKIREAIKKNLSDIVSEENIILSDGKKMVRVPIRSLDEYRFRYDPGRALLNASLFASITLLALARARFLSNDISHLAFAIALARVSLTTWIVAETILIK